MYTIPHLHTDTHTYGVSLAYALITYAQQCEPFASALHTLVHTIDAPECETVRYPIRGLVPRDTEHAVRRAYWLIEACVEKRIPEAGMALSTLVTWARAREWEQPKAFILGLDMGVWPVGIWGMVKRKYEPMSVLIRSDTPLNHSQTLRTITFLTHRVVEKGLVSAGGHTGKLEPELGDWLFGEKSLALFHATAHELKEIDAHLVSLDVPHAKNEDASGTTALAISPSVYLFDIPHGDTLCPMR